MTGSARSTISWERPPASRMVEREVRRGMRARRSLDHQTPKQVETSAAGSVHESDQSLTLLLANVREYAILILDPEGIVRT